MWERVYGYHRGGPNGAYRPASLKEKRRRCPHYAYDYVFRNTNQH